MPQNKEPSVTQNPNKDLPDDSKALFDLAPFPILDVEEGIKTTGTSAVLTQMLEFLIQESLPSDTQLMSKAFAAGDWEKTQHIAHKIKGGAVYIGTIRMKQACQYLGRYWKSGQRDLFEALYHQAVRTIEETMTYIKGWLQQNKS